MGYRRFIVGAAVVCLALATVAVPASAKAAKQVADPNATITYASASGTQSLVNPHTYAGGLSGWQLYTKSYDRLIQVTPDTLGLMPMLATSWKWDATNTQITLQLRKDVTFHDGTPFNADVAVANLKAGTAPGSNGASLLAPMSNVEAVDPATLRLTFSTPFPDAIFALAYYPGMMVSMKGLATPSLLNGGEQGSGPYTLGSLDGALTYRFDRFPGYWNKSHVYPAHFVEAQYVDENTRLNAVTTGKADFGTFSAQTYSQAVADKNLQVVTHTQVTPYVLFMNNTKAPFNNPQVRQAVQLAMDYPSYNAAVNGLCTPEQQALPKGIVGYDPSYKAPKHNVAKAKNLIEQAGANGKTVKMATITFEPFATLSRVAQAQLNAIGLNVQLDIYQPGGTFRQVYQAGGDEMLFGPPSISVLDTSQILDNYVTGIGNPGTKDPAIVEKIRKAELLDVGSKEREKAMQLINKDLMEPANMLWVSVCHTTNIFVGNKNVMGLKDNLPSSILTAGPDNSYLQIAKSK